MLGLVRAVDLIVDTRRQRLVQVFVLHVWVMLRLRVVYEQTDCDGVRHRPRAHMCEIGYSWSREVTGSRGQISHYKGGARRRRAAQRPRVPEAFQNEAAKGSCRRLASSGLGTLY